MKKTAKLLLSAGFLSWAAISITACSRPTEEQIQAAVEAAVNAATTLYASATAYSSAVDMEAAALLSGCPEVALEGTVGDRSLAIRYADNCTVNGLNLSGEITGAWTFAQGEGVSVDLALEDFTITDYTAAGRISLYANALQGALISLDGEMTVNDQTLTFSELTATADLNQTLRDPYDDRYTLDGGGTYAYGGDSYRVQFESVAAEFMCYAPVSGRMTLKSSNYLLPAVIDFGNGECDTVFTVTVGPRTETVDLLDLTGGTSAGRQ